VDTRIAYLVAKDEVIEVVTSLFVGTDNRDWPAVRACLAPQVMFDMSSMSGGAASLVDADAIVEGWRQGLQPMSHVFHQAGNFKVSVGDADAAVFCYCIAMHYRETPSGRNTRMFVGSYDFHLTQGETGWVIDLLRFNLKFLDGNLSLEKD
jgi:hypothetical protein